MAFITFIHKIIKSFRPIVKLNNKFLALTFNDFSIFILRIDKHLLVAVLGKHEINALAIESKFAL